MLKFNGDHVPVQLEEWNYTFTPLIRLHGVVLS